MRGILSGFGQPRSLSRYGAVAAACLLVVIGCSEAGDTPDPGDDISATGPDIGQDVGVGDTAVEDTPSEPDVMIPDAVDKPDADTSPEPDVIPEPDVPPESDVIDDAADAIEPGPNQPRASCVLAGIAGDVIDCPVHIARGAESFSAPTRAVVRAVYATAAAKPVAVVDLKCVGDNCLETLLTATGATIKTGHVLTIGPEGLESWEGDGTLSFDHPLDTQPLSGAYLEASGAVMGDSLIVLVRFQLLDVADGTQSVEIELAEASSTGGEALPVTNQGHILVTLEPGDDCEGTVCFDGNPCTEDTCVAGECVYAPLAVACDDGNPCTTADTCVDGQCVGDGQAASGLSCSGTNLCTEVGTCDGAGVCAYDPALAVDCSSLAGQCADASCNAATGSCVVIPKAGESCDDANACTEGDVCDASGSCLGQALVCDDGVGCTTDSCDAASGCVFSPDDMACDDDNVCTADTCGADGCAYAPADGDCDDGDGCTLEDTCTDGACVGVDDIMACGCVIDADCAPIAAEDLCQGDLFCLEGVCTKVPGTEVICPPNGYDCQDNWTCGPTTGTCTAEMETSCDDEMSCTVDSCSKSKGCLHEVVDLCPLGPLCEVTGSAGQTVECALRVARESVEQLPATGANVRFGWDGSKLELEQLVDSFCFGASCWPFDALTCGADGTGCSIQPLGTGHSLLLVPNDTADWADWISITFVHQSSVDTALSDAVLSATGDVGSDALVIKLRYKLKVDIPEAEPAAVEFTEASFDRVDLPLSASVQTVPSGSVVVTGGAE